MTKQNQPNSLTRSHYCGTCRRSFAGDDRTGHLRSAHPEMFAAQWAAIEAAAARFRGRAA